MQIVRRRFVGVTVALLLTAAAVSGCGAAAAAGVGSTASPSQNSNSPVVLTRAQATAFFSTASPNIKSITRVAVKHMHLSDVFSGATAYFGPGSGNYSPILADQGDRPIWVIAMSGEYVPDCPGVQGGGSCPRFTWAVEVIAAQASSGPPIARLSAGSAGAWPPFFDALPDDGTQ